jgi:hypothetical protein
MSDVSVVDLGDGESNEVVPFSEPSVSPIQGIQGEFGGGDVKFPYFGIIHGVGPNFAKFPKNAGDLLYNGETLIPKPAELSFYGVQKKYVQNLRYDPTGPRPNEFLTTQQVISAGGNLKEFVPAGSDDGNYVAHAVCHIVLFAPKLKNKVSWAEGLDLTIIGEGEYVVPALWTLRGTSYRAIVPQLIMADSRLRKQQKTLAAQRWTLDTKNMKMGANFVFVPVLDRSDKLNKDETLELLAENFGG